MTQITRSRINQLVDLLSGIEAEVSSARDELRELQFLQRKLGTSITLELAGQGQGFSVELGGGQRIRIPASDKGAQVMLRILQERERTWDRSLGSDARPVQAQVQKWLVQAVNAEKEAQASAKPGKPGLSLEELGI